MIRKVACPACGKQVEWSPKNNFRPFCSARCKGMDLGAWAAESYRIAGRNNDPSDSGQQIIADSDN